MLLSLSCIDGRDTFANDINEQNYEISTFASENSSRHLVVSKGVAEMRLNYIAKTKMDSIIVSARLQKYTSGTWKRVKIFDDVHETGRICTVTKSCKITSGGKYRAKFVVTTNNGSNQRTETFYSNVVNY